MSSKLLGYHTSDFDKTSLFTSLVTCSKFAPNRIRRFAISLSIVSLSDFSNDEAICRQVSPGEGRSRSMRVKYGLSGSNIDSASFIWREWSKL